MANPQTPKRVSLNYDNYIQGGLIGDVDVEFLECCFTLEPPENYSFSDRVFFRATLKQLDSGDESQQYWSVGSKEDFVPSEDGNFVLPVGDAEHLRKSSNFFALHTSLIVNCGLGKDKLDTEQGVSILNGTKAHVIQAPAPERAGLKKDKAEGDRPKTVLIASKLISWPWEKGKGKGSPKPAAAGSKPAAAAAAAAEPGEAEGDVDEKAKSLLNAALKKSGGMVELEKIKAVIFQAAAKDGVDKDTRTVILSKVADQGWLEASGYQVVDGNVMPA